MLINELYVCETKNIYYNIVFKKYVGLFPSVNNKIRNESGAGKLARAFFRFSSKATADSII